MSLIEFNNVYLSKTAVSGGKKESEGPLGHFLDITYNNLQMGEKSFEQAESKMLFDTINLLINKMLIKNNEIKICFGGDLINQDLISNFTMSKMDLPFVGLYGACSTSVLSLIMASIYIDHLKEFGYALAFTSSHNASSERQFRNPNEYGGIKSMTQTMTVTGACAAFITNYKTEIRVKRALIGKVIDVGFKNMLDMGRAMAPAACESLLEFFEETGKTPKDYDLILTGDLSKLGEDIVLNVLDKYFGYNENYKDCGLMIYSVKEQFVLSGGSGCACCGIVSYGYIRDLLIKGEIKNVLICATGALMNQTSNLQRLSIPAICHIIELEREK